MQPLYTSEELQLLVHQRHKTLLLIDVRFLASHVLFLHCTRPNMYVRTQPQTCTRGNTGTRESNPHTDCHKNLTPTHTCTLTHTYQHTDIHTRTHILRWRHTYTYWHTHRNAQTKVETHIHILTQTQEHINKHADIHTLMRPATLIHTGTLMLTLLFEELDPFLVQTSFKFLLITKCVTEYLSSLRSCLVWAWRITAVNYRGIIMTVLEQI